MQITVHFYSYFKELAGCTEVPVAMAEGESIDNLLVKIMAQFPKLAGTQKSILIAVGVDYQPRDYVLKAGDEVSLFPPVQGG